MTADGARDPVGALQNVASLDQLLMHHARRRPDAIAFLDPPNRAAFTDGSPRVLTYGDLDRAVTATAARLSELGLGPGSVVALQLPNIAEAVVLLLGVMRAGLIATLIPLRWREADIVAALQSVDASALVVCRRCGSIEHAQIALAVAHNAASIRYLGGFGHRLPDGFVPFDDVFETNPHVQQAALHAIGVITFDQTTRPPLPVSRSHIELLAGGLAVTLETGLARKSTILSTLLTASFAGLAAAIVPWLFAGGTLALHQPFEPDTLADQLGAGAVDAIAIPGTMLEPLLSDPRFGHWSQGRNILALWRGRQPIAAPVMKATRLVDLVGFGEWAVAPLRRPENGAVTPLRPGTSFPDGADAASPSLLRLGRTLHQTISVTGAMVPQQSAAHPASRHRYDGDGRLDTGIAWPTEILKHPAASKPVPLESPDFTSHIELPRASFG